MATVTAIQVKKNELELTPPIIVDINIIEYLYAVDFDSIMNDDNLLDLILTNGWYKQALCDAFELENLTIEHDKTEYKLSSSRVGRNYTLDMFQGNTKIAILNCIVINKELENINKVTPLVEY